ncbi:MAG: acylglycerol kinase family protein [Verrucomicrobia bacterium]|nr:acylglycerol kinase family protein [Verrucomicrobiota bacterium]
MNKTLVIFNPTARSDRAGKLRSRIEALPSNPVVRLTTTSGDARRLAVEAAAEGFNNIVAAGGDGTVNERQIDTILFNWPESDWMPPSYSRPPRSRKKPSAR